MDGCQRADNDSNLNDCSLSWIQTQEMADEDEHFRKIRDKRQREDQSFYSAVVKVIQQTPIKMYNTEIRVKPYFEEEEEDEPLCTILVCGLLGLNKETIELYFENERKAGGDVIKNVDWIKDGKALITYESEEVARKVVNKGYHVLNQQLLEVTLWQPPPKRTWNRQTPEPEPELGPSDTIEVRGIGDALDEETIALYFANNKKSGGGQIKEMHVEKDVAFITYFSEEVAERVIHKDKHVLKKRVLQVMILRETKTNTPTPDCELPLKPVSTVEVYGIDRSLDEETLILYFENTRKSGGGYIENITLNYEDGVASITFKEVMVAERVAQRETHRLNRKNLIVAFELPTSNRGAQSDPEPLCIVEVHGLSPSIDQETLELYFENYKRSGGNTIVNTDLQDGVAYIEFESEEVAQRVVHKGAHTLNKRELTVQIHCKPTKQHKPTPFKRNKQSESQNGSMATGEEGEELMPTSVVKVKGVKRVTTLEAVRYYFENTRRSGGGYIQEFLQHKEYDDIVFITFNDPEVAKTVASREHSVEDKTLHVSLHIPPQPRPFYEDKLLIRGLTGITTKECLFNFLEARSGSVPIDLQRGEKEGVVLITFESKPEFSKLTTVFGKTPLEGAMLQVSKVQVTNCIIVINIPQKTSKNTVWFYFENTRRSNGGPVDRVVMKEEDCSCLVYFEDYKVVDKVVAQKHVINDHDVIVKMFLECLGCPHSNISEMPFKLPDAIIISDLHRMVIRFMMNSDVNKKALAMHMEAVNALVYWPKPETKSNDVVIECTLTHHIKGARMLSKSWKQVATKHFYDFMNNFVIEILMVSQENWKNVIMKINTVNTINPEGVAVIVNREQCSVAIVGITQIVEGVTKDIAFMVKQLEEEAEKEKERTKEQITNLKLIETKMLLAEKYPSKMETKYVGLKVKINQNKNEIVFEGLTALIKSAKCEMYEMKEKYATVTVDLTGSKSCFLLYDSKMAKNYIVKKLKTNHVTAVWEVRDQKLIVCSTSKNTIDRSLELVKGSIVEQSISLTNENVDVVRSEGWKAVPDEQNQKYPGKTAIEIQGNVAHVCGTDDIVSEVLGAVKKFLKTNTFVEDDLNFGKSIKKLIEKDHKDEIATISKRYANLNTQVVTKASNTGFTLRGTSDGVELAKRDLEELSRKVKKKDHSLQCPGIRGYMARNGQDHIQTIEQRHPVVFDTSKDGDEDNHYDEWGMTEIPVDVLVHAADSKLSLTGELGFGAIPKDSRMKVKKTKKGKDPKQGQSDSYPIRVYSMSKKSIDDAIAHLEKIISNEVQRQPFKDDLLINLQEAKVKALMDDHSVNITFKSKTELEVVGMVQNVLEASNKIYSIIRQLAQIEQQKIEAKHLLRIVQWFFIDISEVEQELMKYDPTVNLLIEFAFIKQQPKVAFSDSRGQKYIIDFDKMQEYPETDPSDCVNVIRRDLMKEGSFKTPDSWTDMGDKILKVVTLQYTDQEFQDIVKQFTTSVNSPKFVVIRVDRIQNKTLWMQYQAKKQLLDSTNKGVKNESMLWHGTLSDSVDSINDYGFNRSYCGKNAVAFGDGVYFTVNAANSCSDTYSRPDSSAVKRMYLCQVLTGEYTIGKHGIRVPPAKSGQAASSLYDSVVNNMASPTTFIIFHDTQAYPQYLIFFKKKG